MDSTLPRSARYIMWLKVAHLRIVGLMTRKSRGEKGGKTKKECFPPLAGHCSRSASSLRVLGAFTDGSRYGDHPYSSNAGTGLGCFHRRFYQLQHFAGVRSQCFFFFFPPLLPRYLFFLSKSWKRAYATLVDKNPMASLLFVRLPLFFG